MYNRFLQGGFYVIIKTIKNRDMDENRFNQNQRSSFENYKEVSSDLPATAEQKPDQNMDKHQKIMMSALGVIGLGILVLAILQIKSLVVIPWPDLSEKQTQAQIIEADLAETVAAQKAKDTDGDGLSDYDELNVYLTSPYLKDSDSDTYSDKEEVESGNNPNCPSGQTCYQVTSESSTTQPEANASTENTNASTATNTASTGQTYTPTATELRTILSQSGQFTAEQLSQISDEDLLAAYQEMIKANPDLQSQLMANSASNTESASETVDVSGLTLAPAEIRAMLIEQGFSKTDLEKISDADLTEMYKKALKEVAGNTPSTNE